MGNSYLIQMVRGHDYDRFLQSLFLPPDIRERVLALLALDAELAHVHAHVREEMLGHIRYAWWEESIAAIAEGHKPREHPVLIEIARHQLAQPALRLAQQHRTVYPERLQEDKVGELANQLIAQKENNGWKKAGDRIAKHRKKYGRKWNSWLTIKLLFAAR